MNPVILKIDNNKSATYNMAVDEFFYKKENGIYLRFYSWNPPAVSLGFSQKVSDNLDLKSIEKKGYQIVRRLTGGRAVLHKDEFTYSVSAPIGGIFGETLHETYQIISEAIKLSLNNIGIPAKIESGKLSGEKIIGVAPPCFNSTSRFELTLGGKKILGSAQKRGKNRFLQHGALKLVSETEIVDVLKADKDLKGTFENLLNQNSISLSEYMNKEVTFKEIELALIKGFEESLEFKMELYKESKEDELEIKELEKKYLF